MKQNRKKIWQTLEKIGIYTSVAMVSLGIISFGAVSFIPELLNFAGVMILTSMPFITLFVVSAGCEYIIDAQESVIKPDDCVEIPNDMKCNDRSLLCEDFENQNIYTVSPRKLGIESSYKNEVNRECHRDRNPLYEDFGLFPVFTISPKDLGIDGDNRDKDEPLNIGENEFLEETGPRLVKGHSKKK